MPPAIISVENLSKPYCLGRADLVFHLRLYSAANPMVGVIEGFCSALFGANLMPWNLIAVGTASATVIAVTGCLYFRRKERLFADVA